MMGVELAQSVHVCACMCAGVRAGMRACRHVCVCLGQSVVHMVSKLGNFTQTVVSDHLCWSKS